MLKVFHFKKEAKEVTLDKIPKDGLIWVDASAITKEEAKKLSEKFNLHTLTAEDMINKHTRIKVEEFDNYLFCVFYGLRPSGGLIELDCAVGKNFVITNHASPLDVCDSLMKDGERLSKLMAKGPDFLFHRFLDLEVDNCFVVLEQMGLQIDKLEEEVIKDQSKESLSKLHKMRRSSAALRRTFLAQREKLGTLAKTESKFIAKKATPYFRDIYDHSIRVQDTIDNQRDSLNNVYEIYMSGVSNNMNEVMKTLSIIATIALPLTVISGVYGTNFTNLPGQKFYYGFWIMMLAMVCLCAGMLMYFRRKRWI